MRSVRPGNRKARGNFSSARFYATMAGNPAGFRRIRKERTMYYGYYYDPTYLLLIPGLILAVVAQGLVSSAYAKWSRVRSCSGLTGAEAARRILDAYGCEKVAIEHVPGSLTDHFDPRGGVLRLSDGVYGSNSVAAVAVAAHEAGHAIQNAEGYAPLAIRSRLVPVANIGSMASMPLFLMGIVFSFEPLVTIGIWCFFLAVLFHLVTLPVELNASGRAVSILGEGLPEEEMKGIRAVLRAAALTYVASALQALLQLARLLLLSQSRRRRD